MEQRNLTITTDEGRNVLNYKYDFEEVRAIVALTAEADKYQLTWEERCVIGHRLFLIWASQLNGFKDVYKVRREEYQDWMQIQNEEEEAAIDFWVERTISRFIPLFQATGLI